MLQCQYCNKTCNNKNSHFFIKCKNLYIEIKGYETERDKAKWKQFPKKLKIVRKKEIYEIRKGTFVGL